MTCADYFSQAIEGYELAAYARRLSPRALADYNNTFRKLQKHLGDDRPMVEIGREVDRGFLAAHGHLSKKTVRNHHTGLSALWQWPGVRGDADGVLFWGNRMWLAFWGLKSGKVGL